MSRGEKAEHRDPRGRVGKGSGNPYREAVKDGGNSTQFGERPLPKQVIVRNGAWSWGAAEKRQLGISENGPVGVGVEGEDMGCWRARTLGWVEGWSGS